MINLDSILKSRDITFLAQVCIVKAMLFQRIAGRDKKSFFSNQCKEIEENNRMGKTRDLFKKIRGTKGTRTEMGWT